MRTVRILAVAAQLLPGAAMAQPSAASLAARTEAEARYAGDPALVSLFSDWRRFAAPDRVRGVADFTPASIARKAAGLTRLRARLAAIRPVDPDAAVDARLIEAEMNGLDFDLRVRRPWARDPGFYQTVFGEQSDVPAHEGVSAEAIDLFAYRYPLSRTDASALAARLATVAPLLAQARANLADSQAADLWRYGARAFREQETVLAGLIAGTLEMRTLEGPVHATLAGTAPALRRAAEQARAATAGFADWIEAEAPRRTGPSGVGRENYDWYMKNVQLVPYGWAEQETLLRRELERAQAGLRLEELRNRALPPLRPVDDPQAYAVFAAERMHRFTDFVIAKGFVPDRPYYRAALAAQTVRFTPPAERDFFAHVVAHDPMPLYSHDIHWVELARLKEEPRPDPIRQGPPLFNIYAARSEGFATAFEEVVMDSGLYDDVPHGRELVWIMLANRAARGLASLYVQANEWDLARAGAFHASWTPRGWSDPKSRLVGFEQLLYLRQPGYGTSYVTGKLQLDRLLARLSHRAEAAGQPFDAAQAFPALAAPGILPWPLIDQALLPDETAAP